MSKTPENITMGQLAYDSYLESLSKTSPTWDKLPMDIQFAWEAAANAVTYAFSEEDPKSRYVFKQIGRKLYKIRRAPRFPEDEK